MGVKKGAFCCIATSNLVCFRLNIAQWLPSFWLWWWMITDQVRLVSDVLHSLQNTLLRLVFVLFTFSTWSLAFHETFANSNKKSCTCTEASKHALTKMKQYMYQRKQTYLWCWTVCGPKQNAFADKASQLMRTCLVCTFGVDTYTFEAQIIDLRLHCTNRAVTATSVIWSSFFDVILVLN